MGILDLRVKKGPVARACRLDRIVEFEQLQGQARGTGMNDELGNRLVKVGSYLCGRAQRTNPAAPLCSALFLDISTSLFGF